ncbi:ABC transporter ATP-binding protein [Streptosporangium sp. NPDC051022]|uniref:ABC transporter ATP-binding protein n=1 Tax=Streptosporangium sp. NPDC051022 TaxID=3155752 RepID=UPI0034365815
MNSDDPVSERQRGLLAILRGIIVVCSITVRTTPSATLSYIALTLIGSVAPVTAAWLFKLLLDGLNRDHTDTILWLAVSVAALGVVTGVIPQAARYARATLNREVGLVMQDRLFLAVEHLPGIGWFENPLFLDRLRLAQQAGQESASQAMDATLGLLRAGLIITGFLGTLFVISPVMSLIVMAAGIPLLVSEMILSRRRAKMLLDIGPVERREFFYMNLLSSVEAAKEVRLFGIGSFLRERMLVERRIANIAKRAMDRREGMVQSVLSLLSALVAGGGLLWAIDAVRRGALSLGDITMFVAAIAGVQGALVAFAGDTSRGSHALFLVDHYLAVIKAEPDLPVTPKLCTLPHLSHGIELRDVWFRYSDKHPWILCGVNLNIPYGKALALVGLNGAGKSTLIKLLCRFYDPTKGTILWDGVDIRQVDIGELRQRIGVLFQDYMNYDLSAKENVGLGDLSSLREKDDARIRRSAQRAGIHEKLETLPRGYETLLTRIFFNEADKGDSSTGVILSGGQWQRLALARAFLRDRRELMILDEPSAGLDAEAEHEIHTKLKVHRANDTSILISHRLSAVRDADLIVVLREGEIVERGDHNSLVAAGGAYSKLFKLQASGYETSTSVGDSSSIKID